LEEPSNDRKPALLIVALPAVEEPPKKAKPATPMKALPALELPPNSKNEISEIPMDALPAVEWSAKTTGRGGV
jgi:hypothetical protein